MHVYFVGVGGSGLSSLAQLALDCGYQVSGSDRENSHGTEAVESRGVVVSYTQDGVSLAELHKLQPVDWVVYSAACPPEHPELVFAREKDIKLTKREGLVNHVLEAKNLKLIGVAGTHGKTTTTAMAVWVFKQLGLPISYLIGSNISFGASASYKEESEYFVLEADEFDRHFLKYEPEYSIITSIDHDHMDVYPTPENYYQAFGEYIELSKNILMWDSDSEKLDEIGTGVEVLKKDEVLDSITLLGKHNRENAYQVYHLLQEIGHPKEQIIEAINNFPGTQRRMEQIAERVYTDYAHHPTELLASMQLLQEKYEDIVVVYQPHQNVRQHQVQNSYSGCFDKATQVYWLPTYLSREDKSLEVLTPERLISGIRKNKHIEPAKLNCNLQNNLTKHWQHGKTIVAFGAGDIDDWIRKFARTIVRLSD